MHVTDIRGKVPACALDKNHLKLPAVTRILR